MDPLAGNLGFLHLPGFSLVFVQGWFQREWLRKNGENITKSILNAERVCATIGY